MGQPFTDQDTFRWREDDALAGTWIEDKGNDLSDPDSWLDTNIRIRFLLQNTGDKDETDGYRLEYSRNGGVDWNAVTNATQYVKSVTSDWFADGDGTNQEIGEGVFDEGYFDEDDGTVASFTLADGEESELEWVIQFVGTDCPGNTILLRVAFDDGLPLDSYTDTPSSTFTSTGPPPQLMMMHIG